MRTFHQIDVFTDQPGLGNPVAVVHDADGLSDAALQRFAAWTNLSETTFLLAPTMEGADYRVRIFTPTAELPFAGHPTLGSARAWLAAQPESSGPRTTVVQECGVGLVSVRVDGDRLAFAAPPLIRSGPPEQAELAWCLEVLGLEAADVVDAAWVDNGPGWLALRLTSVERLRAVSPQAPVHGLDVGLCALTDAAVGYSLEVRAFFSVGAEVREDPVTGSLNAGLAQWLVAQGTLPGNYVAAQGMALGRQGRIQVTTDGETHWIGGDTVVVVAGQVALG